jgi:hypothetical protein
LKQKIEHNYQNFNQIQFKQKLQFNQKFITIIKQNTHKLKSRTTEFNDFEQKHPIRTRILTQFHEELVQSAEIDDATRAISSDTTCRSVDGSKHKLISVISN